MSTGTTASRNTYGGGSSSGFFKPSPSGTKHKSTGVNASRNTYGGSSSNGTSTPSPTNSFSPTPNTTTSTNQTQNQTHSANDTSPTEPFVGTPSPAVPTTPFPTPHLRGIGPAPAPSSQLSPTNRHSRNITADINTTATLHHPVNTRETQDQVEIVVLVLLCGMIAVVAALRIVKKRDSSKVLPRVHVEQKNNHRFSNSKSTETSVYLDLVSV
jgi:hypothetical protein